MSMLSLRRGDVLLIDGGRSLSRDCLLGLGEGWRLIYNWSRRRDGLVGVVDHGLFLGRRGIR